MTVKDEILGKLPKLSPAERNEVAAALRLLGSMDAAITTTGPSTADDWLLGGIAAWCVRQGLLSQKSAIYDLQHRDSYKQYTAKLPGVMAFLTKLLTDNGLGMRERVPLGFICAMAMAHRLTKGNYFSVGAMLSQIDKLPEALDDCYPGYVAANMFKHVLIKEG